MKRPIILNSRCKICSKLVSSMYISTSPNWFLREAYAFITNIQWEAFEVQSFFSAIHFLCEIEMPERFWQKNEKFHIFTIMRANFYFFFLSSRCCEIYKKNESSMVGRIEWVVINPLAMEYSPLMHPINIIPYSKYFFEWSLWVSYFMFHIFSSFAPAFGRNPLIDELFMNLQRLCGKNETPNCDELGTLTHSHHIDHHGTAWHSFILYLIFYVSFYAFP